MSNIRPPAAVSYIAAAKFKNEWLKYKLDVFLGVTYFFISNVYVKKKFVWRVENRVFKIAITTK